ncbi:hypothetical protein TNCV_1574171 [Trichonephila clavipes]|nr:hypothetical protein TNCV_1574171 [Trichonephila clavipes]
MRFAVRSVRQEIPQDLIYGPTDSRLCGLEAHGKNNKYKSIVSFEFNAEHVIAFIGPFRFAGGCGSALVKVSDHGRDAMSSSPVPLKPAVLESDARKICRELKRPHVGVVVRRGCQLSCRPLYLTMVQNYEVRPQKPSSS